MQRRAFFALIILLSLLTLFFESCASTPKEGGELLEREEKSESAEKNKKAKKKKVGRVKFSDESYNQAIKDADFDKGLGMIKALGSKANIAKMIDESLILYRSGYCEEADKKFEAATKALDDAFAKSIIQGAATTLFNENLKVYSGTLYEFLLVDAFAALNAYKMGDVELANSLLTRVYDKQKKYVSDYGELVLRSAEKDEASADSNGQSQADTEAALAMIGVSFHIPGDMPKKLTAAQMDSLIYKTSPMADYLQMVVGAQNGSYVDDFTVRELKSLVPQIETDSADLPYAKGRIEVLALTGTIAQRSQKTEWFVFDLLNYGEIVSTYCGYPNALKFKYVWPECLPQKDVVSVKRIYAQGEGRSLSKEPVLLEDFDKAARNDVALKARKAAWRSVWRSTSKKAAGLAGIVAAVKNDPTQGLVSVLAILAGAQGLRAIDLSETADIRQAQALPSKAWAAGFTLDPGTYTVTVEYSNGSKDIIENVKVVSRRPSLVESICAK